MHFFLKMIQQKRLKILILVILLIILGAIQTNPTQPPDLDLIIKRIEPLSEPFISPVCITYANTTQSAVGWIYPIPATESELPADQTTFLPQINNNYDCDFSKNVICNSQWKLIGWQQSRLYNNNFEPTLDTRWEALNTLLTTKETDEDLSHRFDIPHTFNLGVSVRIAKNAQIFFCEGWNPHTYPCYHLNIGHNDSLTVVLSKFKSMSHLNANEELCKYQSDVDVVLEGEWRNFAVKLNAQGELAVIDIHRNVILNCTDPKPLQPIFVILRSPSTNGLWKIHNNRYIFSNQSQVTQLGPEIRPIGGTICVSLYVAMCETCSMSFLIKENAKRVLKEVHGAENPHHYTKWKEIRIEASNLTFDEVQLFVETKNNNDSQFENFWAIDDVRICYKNEIKVTTLDLKKQTNETVAKLPISCQLMQMPNWRPTPHIVVVDPREERVKNYSLSATPTSITIPSWRDLTKEWYITYYEAQSSCHLPEWQSHRRRSQGYTITDSGDIHLNNLLPFTLYKLTVEYVLQGHTFDYEFSTLETDSPTKYELPQSVAIQPTDTTVLITWPDPKCNETYGRIAYQIKVEQIDTNTSKSVQGLRTEYQFIKLKPFRNYRVEITTARGLPQLTNTDLSIKIAYNFSTLPGPPGPVQNIELYSINKTAASIRYDLPIVLPGVPESVQIRVCNVLYVNSCQLMVRELEKCPLWNEKYCLIVDNLIPNFHYIFEVALKVRNAKLFGEKASLEGRTIDKVPGRPSNITYEMVDCNKSEDFCHLKLGWTHPYYPNGDISNFQILLLESSAKDQSDAQKVIHEILPIENRQYKQFYSIIVKYIPYSTHYNISIRATNNNLKGEYETKVIKTDSIENYIDQMPQFIDRSNTTLTFQLPKFDWRLKSSSVNVIVQDNNDGVTDLNEDIVRLNVFNGENQLCQSFGRNWIAKSIKIDNTSPREIIIGDGSLTNLISSSLNKTIRNSPLEPGNLYCISFVIRNEYREVENEVIYHVKDAITEENTIPVPEKTEIQYDKGKPNYIIIFLTCSASTCCAAWIYYRKMAQKRRMQDDRSTNGTNSEPVYESMPFDDYSCNAVFNETYDKLIHE